MRLWPFKNAPEEVRASQTNAAQAASRAYPPVINMGDQEKIDHAHYRLDAIARHCEQTPRGLSAEREDEFRNESAVHIASLSMAKAISREQAAAYRDRIEAGIARAGRRN